MQLTIDDKKRAFFEKFYWKVLKRTLAEIQQPVIDMVEKVDPEDLKRRVPSLLDDKKMRKILDEIWITTGTRFAMDTIKSLTTPKKADPTGQIDYWEDYFRRYSNERSQAVTKQIMDTQTQIINNIIDRNLDEGRQGGLGIPEMQRYMRNDMQDALTEMNKYQAERIARTEVIGSSNKGSFDAVKQSGLEGKKAWLTSKLDGIRQSHLDNEAEGEVDMDHEYAGGCQYPADPEGSPDEIINCRCTIVYNVDEGLVQQPEGEPKPEPEPVTLVQPEPVIPQMPDIEKIQTFEELQKFALQYHNIDITPSQGVLNLDCQKMAIKRIGDLKKQYPKATLNSRPLQLKTAKGEIYASAWSDRSMQLNPRYYNDAAVCSKQFASDQITYFHPRGIPAEIARESIVDHEFGHLLTSTEILYRDSVSDASIYKEFKRLKTEYTKTINGLMREEYSVYNKMATELLTNPAKPLGEEALREIQNAHYRWGRLRNADQFKEVLDKYGIFNQDLNKILMDFDKNYISGYAGKNMDEFVAEGFTDAINNKRNPSPFSMRIKEIIDKKYK